MQTRGGGAKVSFLFFIDIMMCISGAMLFVIMLLVLDLSNGTGYSAGTEKEAKTDTAALQKQIDALFPQWAAMRAQPKKDPNAPAPPAPAPVVAAPAQDPAVLRKLLDAKTAERKKIESEVQDLEREKGQLGEKFKKVSYRFTDAENGPGARAVVVVECSAGQCTLEGPGLNPSSIKNDDITERFNGVVGVLDRYNMQKITVLVLAKPSDFSNAGVIVKGLREKGYQAGIEPLEEDRSGIR